MSDTTAQSEFEDAFHKAAERHERVWVFIAMLLLSLLMIGTLFFVVLDYGGLPLTAGYVVAEISRQLHLLQQPGSPGHLAPAHQGGAMRGVE